MGLNLKERLRGMTIWHTIFLILFVGSLMMISIRFYGQYKADSSMPIIVKNDDFQVFFEKPQKPYTNRIKSDSASFLLIRNWIQEDGFEWKSGTALQRNFYDTFSNKHAMVICADDPCPDYFWEIVVYTTPKGEKDSNKFTWNIFPNEISPFDMDPSEKWRYKEMTSVARSELMEKIQK